MHYVRRPSGAPLDAWRLKRLRTTLQRRGSVRIFLGRDHQLRPFFADGAVKAPWILYLADGVLTQLEERDDGTVVMTLTEERPQAHALLCDAPGLDAHCKRVDAHNAALKNAAAGNAPPLEVPHLCAPKQAPHAAAPPALQAHAAAASPAPTHLEGISMQQLREFEALYCTMLVSQAQVRSFMQRQATALALCNAGRAARHGVDASAGARARELDAADGGYGCGAARLRKRKRASEVELLLR